MSFLTAIHPSGDEAGTTSVDTVTPESPSGDSSSRSNLSNSFILTAGSAARLVCGGTWPSALRMQFLKAAEEARMPAKADQEVAELPT